MIKRLLRVLYNGKKKKKQDHIKFVLPTPNM